MKKLQPRHARRGGSRSISTVAASGGSAAASAITAGAAASAVPPGSACARTVVTHGGIVAAGFSPKPAALRPGIVTPRTIFLLAPVPGFFCLDPGQFEICICVFEFFHSVFRMRVGIKTSTRWRDQASGGAIVHACARPRRRAWQDGLTCGCRMPPLPPVLSPAYRVDGPLPPQPEIKVAQGQVGHLGSRLCGGASNVRGQYHVWQAYEGV